MADRTRFLLVYDIRKPLRLRRMLQVAKTYGEPLQYSVFVCDLTAVERARLRAEVYEVIDQSVDSVALFDLGPATGRGLRCVEHYGASRDVRSPSEPVIW